MALTFVYMLKFVHGYTKVNDSVQYSYTASVSYIPIDNIYGIDIFIFYYLKISCYITVSILQFFFS